MAQISVAAAGNAEKNVNLINARFQAEALRTLRGYDVGVLENSFYSAADPQGLNRDKNTAFMWELKATNVVDIAVGRGMATAYGYDIQSEATVHLSATAPSAGKKYLFIYLQWDLSNPVEAIGSINIHDNGNSSSWAPARKDNLITSPLGVYQMPLYRLEVNTSGAVSNVSDWGELGIITIREPLRAKFAGNAKKADKAAYADGKDDKTIADHLTELYSRMEKLGFKQGSISMPNGSATINTVKRQGNYCIFHLKIDYPKTGTSNKQPQGIRQKSGNESTSVWGDFVVSEGFRPKSDISIKCAAYLAGPGYGDYVGRWRDVDVHISASGVCTIALLSGGYFTDTLQFVELIVGYEATPRQ